MSYRKTPEEKEQKQLDMEKLEVVYEKFLGEMINKKRKALLEKHPETETIFEGWLYGVYVAILDYRPDKETKGKLFYLFENIQENINKYKLSYTVDDKKNCVFNSAELKNFPKSYLSVLKRHNFDLNKEQTSVSELVCAHRYKLDESAYIHHADYNNLNNNIKNLVPLDKEFFDGLSEENQKSLEKAQQYIPEKFKIEFKKKPKDVVKMEYRACDLFFNHEISVEKIAVTLRNRLNKAAVQRTVKLYKYFKIYAGPSQERKF